MAPVGNIDFAQEFESPLVRTRFDVLLLLASSLRPHLLSLALAMAREDTPAEWNEVVTILAERFGDQISKLRTVEQTKHIWDQFWGDAIVANLGKHSKEVLGVVLDEITSRSKVPQNSVTYLEQANSQAADWIARVVKKYKIAFAWSSVQRSGTSLPIELSHECKQSRSLPMRQSNAPSPNAKTRSFFGLQEYLRVALRNTQKFSNCDILTVKMGGKDGAL